MSTLSHLKKEESGRVITVRLNRPARRNAFHPEMIRELSVLFRELEQRSDLDAIVLCGEGPSFSAGGDLDWMRSMVGFTLEENVQDARQLFDMYLAMSECSHPLIGVVHGHVMGGGIGLISVCDVVLAESQTLFALSEGRIGLSPAVITPFVKRKAQWGRVLQWMLTAETFSAEEAERCGLVHYRGKDIEIQNQLKGLLEQIRRCGPEASRDTKRLAWATDQTWIKAARELSTFTIATRRVSAEGQEGLQAFLEKRAPGWTRRGP
jgi:methylglutaconyl-CoA hydratase